MKKEDKELLIKDLFARLPYNTKIQLTEYSDLTGEKLPSKIKILDYCMLGKVQAYCTGCRKDEVKPYLFPLSSMTDELWDKEFSGCGITEFTRDSFKYGCETLEFNNSNPSLSSIVSFINLLIKNHFDIYGLIEKGLALKASEGMYN